MDRLIKKKKKDHPDWLINGLKGLLLFLLFWNINKNLPENYFGVSNKPRAHSIYPAHNIEEVSFTQLLSTTQPKIDHFMKWGGVKIPFSDPELPDNQNITYQHFSKNTFKRIWTDTFNLQYKGHDLNPNKVNAIFIDADGIVTRCEDEGNFKKCFHSNLRHHLNNFALWLSIETEEGKTFFSKIKVSDDPRLEITTNEEVTRYWKKLISRDKHKYIDNLTVVKPVFQNHNYILKWGNWEKFCQWTKRWQTSQSGDRRIQRMEQSFSRFVQKWRIYTL